MKISGRAAIESALTAIGERLELANAPCAIVVLGGAAMNLLGLLDRPTIDVDVLARADDSNLIAPPDPLPEALRSAIAAVARDMGLPENWMNTAVAGQWRFGLPPGLGDRIEWREYHALRVGIVNRRDLVCFKLYASADQTGPNNVHTRDLLVLKPDAEELAWAAAWVREQDPSPDFHAVVHKVVAYVLSAIR